MVWFKKWFIVGIVFAVVNTCTLGYIGLIFAILVSNFFKNFLHLTVCSGEGCWGWSIIVGDICLIVFFLFYGALVWILTRIFEKIKSKSQNK